LIVKGAFPNAEVHVSAGKGDGFRLYERNKDPNDVPLAICYNLGSDFTLRTPEEQKARILAWLKLFRVGVNEVMEDMGRLVGAHPPKIMPHKSGELGGGSGGRKMARRNYQMGGREIVTSANIPCHSIESFWRVVKLGPKGGRPPCPGGLPGSGEHS
jgi:hypothetical protein